MDQLLVEEVEYLANLISTDDFTGPLANQTNLPLERIIGIGSVAENAYLTSNTPTPETLPQSPLST